MSVGHWGGGFGLGFLAVVHVGWVEWVRHALGRGLRGRGATYGGS